MKYKNKLKWYDANEVLPKHNTCAIFYTGDFSYYVGCLHASDFNTLVVIPWNDDGNFVLNLSDIIAWTYFNGAPERFRSSEDRSEEYVVQTIKPNNYEIQTK